MDEILSVNACQLSFLSLNGLRQLLILPFSGDLHSLTIGMDEWELSFCLLYTLV